MKVPPKRKGNTPCRVGHFVKTGASMKVPPKRKGNPRISGGGGGMFKASMKVPPKRKGNKSFRSAQEILDLGLNESPSEKEGKSPTNDAIGYPVWPRLNESPSEKEGKWGSQPFAYLCRSSASMKVPPKRKGNRQAAAP